MVEDDDLAHGAASSGTNAHSAGQAGGAGAVREGGDGGAAAAGQGKEQEEAVVEEEEEEEVLEEPDEDALGKMSSVEQRLFKIRLKMNKVWLLAWLSLALLDLHSLS